jgi:ABC-type sugar transport system permease subunit
VGVAFLSPALVFSDFPAAAFLDFYLSFTNGPRRYGCASEFVGLAHYERLFNFDRWMRYGNSAPPITTSLRSDLRCSVRP